MFGTISKKRDIRSRDSDEVCRLCEIHNWVIRIRWETEF